MFEDSLLKGAVGAALAITITLWVLQGIFFMY